MAKLLDVAKAAGVSITTASFVLNGRSEDMRIAPQTAEKVITAAKRLEYIPNIAAKRLIYANTAIPEIALVWQPSLAPSFLGHMIINAQRLFSEKKIGEMHITICTSVTERLKKPNSNFLSKNYNGVIASPQYDYEFEYINNLSPKIPFVLLHVKSDLHSNVVVDYYKVGRKAAKVFAAGGYRHVAIMYTRHLGFTSQEDTRYDGFMDECAAHGMTVDAFQIPSALECTPSAHAQEKARELLECNALPEAIFIQNDSAAIGFATTLRSEGVHIPGDIKIITYGDDYLSSLCSPSITTIDYPSAEVTYEALKLLSEHFADPLMKPKRVTITPTITFRQSCPKPDGWED